MSFDYKSKGKSGSGTAGSSLTAIGSTELNGQLIIKVATGGDGIYVCSADDSAGLLVAAGEMVNLMVDSLAKVRVKRQDATDVDYTFWAF